ncbi:MAG: hypothetical protein ACE5HU_08245 [Acidobacteriota bacterium]
MSRGFQKSWNLLNDNYFRARSTLIVTATFPILTLLSVHYAMR